jgi:hypothetical protein
MRERWPTSQTDELAVTVGGQRHRGQRVVLTVSDHEIRQEIRYGEWRKVDPDTYRLGEADFMRSIAKEILFRLVTESKGGAPTRPTKVDLPPRTRRRRREE